MKTTKFLGITVGILAVVLAGVLIGGGAYLKGEYNRTTYYGRTLITMAITLMGFFASASFAQEEAASTETQTVESEVVADDADNATEKVAKKSDKKDPRADRAKERFERKDAKKSEIAAHKAEKQALKEERAAARAERKEAKDAEKEARKAEREALKEERFPSKDSEMVFHEKEKEYAITDEVYGNEIRDNQLQELVQGELDAFVKEDIAKVLVTIDIPESFYILPEITHDDIELNNIVNIYNRYVKASVTYVFGSYKEKIDWDTIKDWIVIEDGVGSINEELAYEYVEQLGYKYDTLHYDRNFHTSIGTDIVIPSSENDYGYMIYTDGEFSQLLQDIESNKDVEREPVYYTTASDYGNPVFYRRDTGGILRSR